MAVRSHFGKYRGPGIGLLISLVLLGIGCSRPLTLPAESEVSQPDSHQAQFGKDDPTSGLGMAEDSSSAGRSASDDSPPFHDRQSLPAGTLISVRLRDTISVEDVEANKPFDAVVVEPVVIEGNTVIPSGAAVAGLVEAARTSQVKANRGYIRLSLASFHLQGVDVPMQTASLFARQFPITTAPASVVYLEKGRRLTFRLTKPVYLASQRAQVTH